MIPQARVKEVWMHKKRRQEVQKVSHWHRKPSVVSVTNDIERTKHPTRITRKKDSEAGHSRIGIASPVSSTSSVSLSYATPLMGLPVLESLKIPR